MESLEELEKMLGSTDEEERRQAVRSLSVSPPAQVQSFIVTALGDESWRVRKEAVDVILSFPLNPGLVEELISLLTVQGNAGLRNSVVEVLQTLGEQILPQLSGYLGHEDPGVRKFIVDIMGGIGSPDVVPLLTQLLLDDDSNVTAAAAESLGLIRDAAAIPELLRALKREDLLIRYAVLEALVKIGSPIALDAVIPLAGEPLLRKALFECIGALGGADSTPLLLDGLKDRVRNVREAALTALAVVLQRSSEGDVDKLINPHLKSLAGSNAVEFLMSLLESQDKKIKGAALAILGVVGDMRAIEGIVREYRDESMQPLSLQALISLGETAGPLLRELFATQNEETRCIIAHISGELCFAEGKELVFAGLSDTSPQVRALSAEAVGKAELVELIPSLVSLLADRATEVRRKAVSALIRLSAIASDEVAESASSLSESEDPDSRMQAVRLYAALRDVSHLMLMSKDEHPLVRRESVTSLGELKVPESVARIAMLLTDEEADVRLAAANALGMTTGEDGAQSLILAIDDSSPRVRVAALKSLGRRQEKSATKRVIALVDESSGMLLLTALQTLVQISGKAALPYLLKAQGNADEEVARVAAALLEDMVEKG